MTRRSLLATAGTGALTLLLPGCQGQLSTRGPTETALAEQLQRQIPQWIDRFRVPGASIVTLENARISWTASFGVRRSGGRMRVDERTIFEAASLSKPLFAYAVMKLAENGVLDLDRPLDEYLPAPYAPEEPATSNITARMVLSHTTGLPNWRKGARDSSPLYLLNPPGRQFRYSGEGFVYLQTVVEELVAMDVGAYLRFGLLKDLEMSRSSYTWRDSYINNYAHGHDAQAHPRQYPFKRQANTASSLYTTPREYANYLLVMMRDSMTAKYQLAPKTLRDMLTPVSRKLDGFHYGLGWGLCRTVPDRSIVYHGGSNSSGHRCLCAFETKAGTGFVLMTNGKGGAELRRHVANVVYPGARLGDALGG